MILLLAIAGCVGADVGDSASWTASDPPDPAQPLVLPGGSGPVLDGPPARVREVEPAPDAQGVPLDGSLRLAFSQRMDTDALVSIRLEPSAALVPSWRDEGRVLHVAFPGGLSPSTWYTATVGGVTAGDGTVLDVLPWRFYTVDSEPPRVVDTAPAAGAHWLAGLPELWFAFDEPMNPSTAVFRGAPPGTWSWDDDRLRATWTGPAPAPGTAWEVTVEASDRSGHRMAAPARLAFDLALAELVPVSPRSGSGADWRFVEVAASVGLVSQHGVGGHIGKPGARLVGGLVAGDVDGDGYIDVVPDPGALGDVVLRRNQGDGTFRADPGAIPVAAPGYESGGVLFDLEGDGDLDLMLHRIYAGPGRVLANDGTGAFSDVTATTGIDLALPTYAAAFGDLDRDGDLDLFLSHWELAGTAPANPRFLWRNEGRGRFTDVTAAYGLYGVDLQYTFTPTFTDLDQDGWPELLVAADYGWTVLFDNDRGTLLQGSPPVLTDENGMGAAVGDYDDDGDLDWFVTAILDDRGPIPSWGGSGNRMYRNRGNGTFEDRTDEAGVRYGGWGWGACFADLDLDTHLDLVQTNGMWITDELTGPFHRDPTLLYHNDGDGSFTERAAEVGLVHTGEGRGVGCFDYDRDGDLDVFISESRGLLRLYRNDLPGGHFLGLRLVGREPNTEAGGARVWVTAGDAVRLHEVRVGGSYAAQGPTDVHLGLGAATVADLVRIVWPDGSVQTLPGVPGDRFYVVEQP